MNIETISHIITTIIACLIWYKLGRRDERRKHTSADESTIKRLNDNRNILVQRGRRSGNTTRLADFYIQKLFTEGFIKVKDHYDYIESHRRLFEIIHRRLYAEHGIGGNPNLFKISIADLTIRKNK